MTTKNSTGKLIIKGHEKNPFVKFWNWGWNIYYKNPEVWNYLIVGGLTTIIAIASKMIMLNTIFNSKVAIELQYSEIISWILAVLFAYVANKIFVFKTKGTNILKEIISFTGGRVFTQLIQMFIMWLFVSHYEFNSNTWVLIFTLICQVMQIVVNYVISKLIVFKGEKNEG